MRQRNGICFETNMAKIINKKVINGEDTRTQSLKNLQGKFLVCQKSLCDF